MKEMEDALNRFEEKLARINRELEDVTGEKVS
jgi:hypothetical protein